MNKKMRFIIVVGSFVILSFSVFSFAATDESFSGGVNDEGMKKMLAVAHAISDYNNSVDSKREKVVIGEINGDEIYASAFELNYKKAVAFGSGDPYEDAINSTKEQVLDLQYAQENDISVTKQEVSDYVAYQRDLYEQESNSKVKAALKSYIKALGLSEDEYWDDYEVDESRNYLLHCKVLKHQEENNLKRDDFLNGTSLKITNKAYQEQLIDETIINSNEFIDSDNPGLESKQEESIDQETINSDNSAESDNTDSESKQEESIDQETINSDNSTESHNLDSESE